MHRLDAGDTRPRGHTPPRRSITAFGVAAIALALVGATNGQALSGTIGARAQLEPSLHQTATLTGAGEVGAAGFGQSVALSADGTTALVGADSDDQSIGAAWVFARSGDAWAQQGPKLTGQHGVLVGGGLFGASVALSANGDTALIGSPDSNADRGAAWLYTRTDGEWSPHAVQLSGRGERGGGWFGSSVALSANGKVALVGGALDQGGSGAAWVFTRSGSRWVQDGPKLTVASAQLAAGAFGSSVALSSTGLVALVGASDGAYLFVRAHGSWEQRTGALGVSGSTLATSVALSGNGEIALIGDYSLAGRGSAWLVSRVGQPGSRREELRPDDEIGEGEFGESVALSANGTSAVVGGPLDNAGIGAAWRFVEARGRWAERGGPLLGDGELGDAQFGRALSLSSGGTTALIGGPLDANAAGAVWLFRTAT